MDGWKYVLLCSMLVISLIFVGGASAQEESEEEEEDPFGGLFDPEDMELEVSLEWESLDTAELSMSMELDLGGFALMLRQMLDEDQDGEIEEAEISELESLFDENETEEGFLGLDILIDNVSAQKEFESGWTGLLGNVNSNEPLGMYATITYSWTIDTDLDRHSIILRAMDVEEEEEEEDDNITYVDDDDDDEGMPFNMTFVIKLPGGWKIDQDTVEPQTMKQFIKDDGTIELTQEDVEAIGETEGDIVSLEIVKGAQEAGGNTTALY